MLPAARIAELLRPFLGDAPLPPELTAQLHTYLELLLRWNARMNLTAVRDPEQIVIRHFGESLFAGLPIKLLLPEIRLTLIESQNKKATFLREVIRTLGLHDAEVYCGRAEF